MAKTGKIGTYYGHLYDYKTGKCLRLATKAEMLKGQEVLASKGPGSETGVFLVDSRAVYVEGGSAPTEAKKAKAR